MKEPVIGYSVRIKGRGQPVPELTVSRDLSEARFDAVPRGTLVSFEAVVVRNVDFRGILFPEFRARGTLFERCDFGRARFAVDYASYLGVGPTSMFVDCSFERADLRHTDPGLSRFERCSFAGAKIHDWRSEGAEFIDCKFPTRLTRASFSGRPIGYWAEQLSPPRSINDFRGNDFSGSTLVDCSFRHGIDIAMQRWPDDPGYIRLDRIGERIRRAREIVSAWPEKAREDGLLVLRIYSSDGFEEQSELFVRRDDLAGSIEGLDRIWELLTAVL